MSHVDALNFELRLVGQRAVKNAIDKLEELASGSAREGKDFESTDLLSAQALVRAGIDLIKAAKSGAIKPPEASDRDIFDVASSNPWDLKNIE